MIPPRYAYNPPAPCRLDHRLVILCSEDDVIMQAQVLRRHMGLVYDAPAGAWNCFILATGGLHHRLISNIAPGLGLRGEIQQPLQRISREALCVLRCVLASLSGTLLKSIAEGPKKSKKKACHFAEDSIDPNSNSTPHTEKMKKVLTRFWRFSYKRRFTLKFHPHH